MKILIVGIGHEEAFATHITNSFAKMGHEAWLFDPLGFTLDDPIAFTLDRTPLKPKPRKIRRRLWDTLCGTDIYRTVLERQLDRSLERIGEISFVIVCSDFLPPRTVQKLKERTKAVVAMWFPDPVSSFRRHMFVNAPYDVLFFKDPYIVHRLGQFLKRAVVYLPEACQPYDEHDMVLSEDDCRKYECDVAIAGNVYAHRISILEQLLDYDLKIWGHPPPRWAFYESIQSRLQYEFVGGASKVKAFRGARIALNTLHPAEIWGVNVRTFEIAAAGGFQMMDWRPGISQLFADKQELVCYKGVDDLKAKISEYLGRPEERAEIAAAGQRRALAEHTYAQRLQLMLDVAFRGAEGYQLPELERR